VRRTLPASSVLGSDVEMIAANHRCTGRTATAMRTTLFSTTTTTTVATPHRHRAFSTRTSLTVDTTRTRPHTNEPSSAPMQDEYGAMDDSGQTYTYLNYPLENGQVLAEAQLRYQTYGQLNETRDNVMVVCHALTGNASLHAWWGDMLGPGKVFDTDKYLVVCCNILGSCYGSTSPVSIRPGTDQPYGLDFPDVSVKDTVRLQLCMLRDELKVASVHAVVGGSFGGMQAVEFAVQAGSTRAAFTDAHGQPFCKHVVPIACGAQHSAWQIAISEVQRQAIYQDPAWPTDPFRATHGLRVARQLGMISYRTPQGYGSKFGRERQRGRGDDDTDGPAYGSHARWQVKSYLEYQGVKFLQRFDPVTYVKLTEQMDSHDVTRQPAGSCPGTVSKEQVLGHVTIPVLVLGIDSDVLYPLAEQQELARLLPNATLEVIHSDDGHDGFLLEQEQVAAHIQHFLTLHERPTTT
jgi:homoserine O-acetyltransferase